MHSGQLRKLSYAPYILHPLETAVIVSTITQDQDLIIASLLHDVIEDTPATAEDVEKEFGARVLALVNSETENKRHDLPATATWKIRKTEALDTLAKSGRETKILWLADKLSNIRAIAKDYRRDGDAIFNVFNEKRKSEHEWYYRTVLELVREELGETLAFNEYERLVNYVFEKGE